MRTFALSVGLIGVLATHAAFAQEPPPAGAPPADGQPAATQPPPAEAPPPAPAVSKSPSPFGAAPGPTGPSVWGVLPWGGFGLGARYMIPLPITQLLTRTKFHDYWALEFGADILRFNYDYAFGTTAYSYNWTEIIPVVGMMWQFWITDDFAVYPKVEIGYAFGWYSDTQGGTTSGLSGGNHLFPDGTAGLLYKLGNGITLRAEAGYVGGKVGLAWLF